MQNVSNNSNQVQQAYASSNSNSGTLDMSTMSIDNILQYVVLTLMDTRDNAASSIQGLMSSVQANNKTAKDIQDQASAVQGISAGEGGGAIVDTPTWQVDKADNTIQLDNGYSITFGKGVHGDNSQWQIHGPDGKTVTIWGDPHVDTSGDGKQEFEFYDQSTFVLADGTKITVGTEEWGSTGHYLSANLTITKGNQSVKVSGIDHGYTDNPDNQTLNIGDVTLNGLNDDANTEDGDIYQMGTDTSKWTKYVANDTYVPKSQVQGIIDKLEDLNVKLNGEDPQDWLDGKSGDYLKKADLVELNGYLNQAASDANQVGQNQQTMLSQNVQNLGNIQKNISAVLSKLIDTLKDIISIIR
ncbi:DUF1521 domain-containing protein [Vibrio marisflavi]|uniref:DUF1521 domain-containing protein n=1 Tax=Vibrio marisflavi CECT 7928 TaxID=634439 RepID=A0ABN8DYN8_9VIBR|nr:DUF1521 domain-containing protein [Vibrio marisflavi]CAH0536020.1 hypothetical protein VMF7928_00116 [Vibrio marisflavi CECT 7928]